MQNLAVVIAHYDPMGRLARYLLRFAAHLDSVARRVVFVSTGLNAAAASQIGRHAEVIVRDNYGYDFWSYKTGIEALGDLTGFDALWILNSSFIMFDPGPLCDRLLRWSGDADLLGLTQCADRGPHVQSYCVAFRTRRVLDSPAFAEWWGKMTPISDRLQVILRHEIGMSQHFVRSSFKTGAVFVPDRQERLTTVLRGIESRYLVVPALSADGPLRLMLRDADLLNPTHYAWEALLDRLGILKIDLVRDNPHGIDLRELQAKLMLDPSYLELFEDALDSVRAAGRAVPAVLESR
jgi:rhamnosyltransferase